MNYLSVLKKYNLTPDQLSPSIRKKIAAINELENDIEKVTGMLEDGNLSVQKRKKMEDDLEEGKSLLPEMDEKVCSAIESWYPRRDEYAAKGAALKAGREAKKKGAGAKQAAPAAPTVVNQASGSSSSSAGPNADSSPVKKKGMSMWGVLGIGAFALIATIVGINMHNGNGK